jgi:hypothetical protein
VSPDHFSDEMAIIVVELPAQATDKAQALRKARPDC